MEKLLIALVACLIVAFVALAATGHVAAASVALCVGFLLGAAATSVPTAEQRTAARQQAQATRQPENLPTTY